MKTILLQLTAVAIVSGALVSCETPPPPPPVEVHHYYHPKPKPAPSNTPEDFRAITPPSSYSR